jgi:hypothetical protein
MARYNNRPLGLSQTELADWLGVGRSRRQHDSH